MAKEKRNTKKRLILLLLLLLVVWVLWRFVFTKKTDTTDRNANVDVPDNNVTPPVSTEETWADVSPAVTECIGNKVHVKQVSNKGNYRMVATNTDCGVPGSEPEITTPVTETHTISLAVAVQNNSDTYDFSPMFGTYDNSKFIANFGFSSAVFKGDTVKVEALMAGWSHMYNSACYPNPILPDDACSKFITFSHSYGDTLRNIAQSLSGTFPAAANALLNENWNGAGADAEFMTQLGAHFSSHALMVDNPAQADGSRWGGYCLFDQEEVFGNPPKLYFFIKLANAVQAYRPQSKVVYYGHPSTNLWYDYDSYYKGITAAKAAEYKASQLYGNDVIRGGNIYFDGQNGYVKASLPNGSIYEKSGGNYVTSGGKRVFRVGDFSETMFGKKNTWLAAPHSSIFNKVKDSAGNWIHDVRFAVATPYRFHLNWKIIMSQCNFSGGFGSDSSRWRNHRNKPVAVQSLLTEPGTYGQNNPWRRWVGEDQIKFNVLAPLMMGFGGYEQWETGFGSEQFKNPDYPNSSGHKNLPTKGTPSFGGWMYENQIGENTEADNFSRFEWATKAVAEMRKIYANYTQNETLRFVDFTNYGSAVDLKEVIMVGMYQGNNMHVLCYYPYNDPEDKTKIEFDLNGTKKAIEIDGRKVKLLHFTGNFTGLEPQAFKAKYKNIDGEWRKVTGNPEMHNY